MPVKKEADLKTETKPEETEPTEQEVKKPEPDLFDAKDVFAFRRRRMIKVNLGDTDDRDADGIVSFWASEFALPDMFNVTKRVKNVLSRLVELGVVKKKEGDPDPDPVVKINGIFTVIEEATEDVYEILGTGIYTSEDRKGKIQREELDDMAIGHVAIMLRALVFVNWEHGSLKKALAGVAV